MTRIYSIYLGRYSPPWRQRLLLREYLPVGVVGSRRRGVLASVRSLSETARLSPPPPPYSGSEEPPEGVRAVVRAAVSARIHTPPQHRCTCMPRLKAGDCGAGKGGYSPAAAAPHLYLGLVMPSLKSYFPIHLG